MATPSITMIPSGYKPEKVYSVLPTNGDGDLFFDRNTPATRVNKDGLIEQLGTDVPTLDYSNGSCPSLLLERYSLNLALYSEDFSQWWQKTNSTVTTNQTTSPSGDLTADKLQRTSTTYNYLGKGISKATQQLNMTISIFVKQGEGDFFTIRGQGDYPNRIDAIYQFSTNELNTSVGGNNFTVINSSVKEHINGWVRLSISFNTDNFGSFTTFFSPRNTSGFIDHNDSSSSSFVYIWGAQLEEQPYATSYIPTTSETASRSGDSFSKTGLSSYISSTAGVLYAEIASLSTGDNTTRVFSLNDGGSTNVVYIGFSSSGGRIYAGINYQIVAYFTPTDPTDFHKVAIKYEDNNTKFFVNGNQIGSTETTQTVPSGLSQIKSTSGLNSDRFYGKVKDLRVYNTLLTDLELKELTTI